mgnify:FL=1
MKKLFLFGLLPLLLSCGPRAQGNVVAPAIRIETDAVTTTRAVFKLSTINAVSVSYGYSATGEPSLEETLETGGTLSMHLELTLEGLLPGTDYTLSAQGTGPEGEKGSVTSVKFSTTALSPDMYTWEKSRTGVPVFADMSLITLGRHNPAPPVWTAERFASHVQYTDGDGNACWLFDSFLCLDSYDPVRGLSYTLTNGKPSSVKASWEDLLDLWLGAGGAISGLDEAVGRAAASLGAPPSPRYVIMALPDPVMFSNFADKTSSTVYWGELDGRSLDFSRPEDQEAAYRWYMDECRRRFDALRLGSVELAGFYVLSEELHLSPEYYASLGLSATETETFNSRYKHWEEIVPRAAAYAHSLNEGLWWIPYNLAPGYRVWKELGFDLAFMQPNYYWDNNGVSHPLDKTASAIKRYRMGIEIEFEYSLVASVMSDGRPGPDGSGNMVFYLKDVPMLRDRVREYMQAWRDTGLYGVLPVAVYSGTDAWHQLATSTDPGDIQMFRELCSFLVGSPLKAR